MAWIQVRTTGTELLARIPASKRATPTTEAVPAAHLLPSNIEDIFYDPRTPEQKARGTGLQLIQDWIEQA